MKSYRNKWNQEKGLFPPENAPPHYMGVGLDFRERRIQ
jgi:hypothetical protein